MGSLSPKTRNAQVTLYQSGDVDFLSHRRYWNGYKYGFRSVYFQTSKNLMEKIKKIELSEIGQILTRRKIRNDGSWYYWTMQEINSEEVDLLENTN